VNRLELWRINEDGMSMISSTLIYGTIAMLQRLQPKDSKTDLLFIGTDRLQYFTAAWDPTTQQLKTVQHIDDAGEDQLRESQSQNNCLVDPTGKFMAIHLWEGVMTILRMGTRKGSSLNLDWMDQIRLTELFIKGSIFLDSHTGPKIAFLYQTRIDKEDAKLAVYRLTDGDRNELPAKFNAEKGREIDMSIPDPFAQILIPVPIVEDENKRYHYRNNEARGASLGGLIVVGETVLIYIDSQTHATVNSVLKEPRIFVAWCAYDITRYFLADEYGQLFLLVIHTDGTTVERLEIKPIGTASRASCLVYMGNNMLFVGSHHGDSQLLRFNEESYITELVQTIPSIAPILDFAVMDLGSRQSDTQLGNVFSSGQARIIAGCGVHQDGSLRSIRSGVGLEDIGILDQIENTRGLFTLKSYKSPKADILVVPCLLETRVFKFDADGRVEELDSFQGLLFDEQTLVAANLPNGQILQITQTSVVLLDVESGVSANKWSAPEGKTITGASANNRWALLSIDGRFLVSLDLANDLAMIQQEVEGENQIACIHAAQHPQDIGVVGFWTTGSISVVDLKTLNAIHAEVVKQTEDSASIPRDLAMVQLHSPHLSGPTLFVAMEDGNVVTFNVSQQDYSLSGRKSVTLGNRQAVLHVLPQENGTCDIFATTEHSSLIYSSEGRIIFSAVAAEDAAYVAPFDSEAYPESIILASEKNKHLRIAHIDTERRTHAHPLPMGETVRRVAYSPALRVFALGCIKKELVNSEELVSSSIKLVDEINLSTIGTPYPLDGSSSSFVELVECVIRAELPDSSGQLSERFIVGTSFLVDPDIPEHGEERGRILVLGVDSERNPYQLISYNLKGACRCLAIMNDDKIVAGLSKTIVVYNYSEETSMSGRLQKLASIRPSTFPVDLDVDGNFIGIGDLMQSLAVVEFIPPTGGNRARLEERARHFQHAWVTSVCHILDESNSWLEADARGNLVVLRRNPDAPTEHDRKQMEQTSAIHLGEQVNRIRKVHVTAGDNAVVVPKAFLATVSTFKYGYDSVMDRENRLIQITNWDYHRSRDRFTYSEPLLPNIAIYFSTSKTDYST
jgi:DNA damage-binding protein 1